MKAKFERIELTGGESTFRSYWIKQNEFPFQWHYHPELELTYIHQGNGTRLVGDKVEQFEEGDLIFLGGNLPHTWASEQVSDDPEAAQLIGIQFKEELLSEFQLGNKEFENVLNLFKRADRGIRFFGETTGWVAEKLKALIDLKGLQKWMQLVLILDYLGKSEEYELLSSLNYQPMLGKQQEQRIVVACNYIHEHFVQPVPLSELANLTHMTETSFCRFFKKMTGKSLSDYVNDLRVARACKLLIENTSSINEIAYASGFNSITHFNRMFLRKKGVSPSRFRGHFRV